MFEIRIGDDRALKLINYVLTNQRTGKIEE